MRLTVVLAAEGKEKSSDQPQKPVLLSLKPQKEYLHLLSYRAALDALLSGYTPQKIPILIQGGSNMTGTICV